jgi:hypothetical protein
MLFAGVAPCLTRVVRRETDYLHLYLRCDLHSVVLYLVLCPSRRPTLYILGARALGYWACIDVTYASIKFPRSVASAAEHRNMGGADLQSYLGAVLGVPHWPLSPAMEAEKSRTRHFTEWRPTWRGACVRSHWRAAIGELTIRQRRDAPSRSYTISPRGGWGMRLHSGGSAPGHDSV